ncbi:MAG: hypothetical protein ACKO9Q_07020, partial [Pirellula sp.]
PSQIEPTNSADEDIFQPEGPTQQSGRMVDGGCFNPWCAGHAGPSILFCQATGALRPRQRV